MPQALVSPSAFDWLSAMCERVCSFVYFHVAVCEQYFRCFLGVSFGYMQRRAALRCECACCVCVSARAGVCASSRPGWKPCLSPSTGSICPLGGRDKEANSKIGKQIQLGRPEVLQAGLRLPLLGRNRWRETRQSRALRCSVDVLLWAGALMCTRPRWHQGFGTHRAHSGSWPPFPRLPAGSSNASKRLSGFGALRLGALAPISEPISGCLQAPRAVEEGTRGGVLALAPSPAPPPPTHPFPARGSFRNRPAAANSLAGGGCKRRAVERFN